MQTHICSYTHTDSHADTQRHTQTHTNTQTYIDTHRDTCTKIHTITKTHRHRRIVIPKRQETKKVSTVVPSAYRLESVSRL